MKYYKFLFLFLCLQCVGKFQLIAQSNWTTINSTRGNFQFSFPQNVIPIDTLNLLSYFTNMEDSTIVFQVNFIDSVYISGNDELQTYLADPARQSSAAQRTLSNTCYVDSIETVLVTYAQMYQQTTEGTIEGFVTSDYQPCYIRGKELTIRHPNLSGDEGYNFVFTRYYYWNSKFLAFTVTGPEEKLSQLYAYKNQFFDSIILY
jgi:hypothetical protein